MKESDKGEWTKNDIPLEEEKERIKMIQVFLLKYFFPKIQLTVFAGWQREEISDFSNTR